MLRTTLSAGPIRTFHSSPAAYKTVAEKVSEVAEKVNKGVGKGLASAIEKGEKATSVAKEKLEDTKEKKDGEETTKGKTVEKED
ncbi:hypothetical protein BYT27DRAFT_7189780 [Phlegmacium glaucopus]|nr:hypothetical protein BYT27DRAFT_7189780 [Phlegmacium glaucopus]